MLCVTTQNVPKFVEGKSQGNNKTSLRKGVGFFLSREGLSQIFLTRPDIKIKQDLDWVCGWNKARIKLGYGVTNVNELQNSLQGKRHRGKIALSYSQNAFGLVIKEEIW